MNDTISSEKQSTLSVWKDLVSLLRDSLLLALGFLLLIFPKTLNNIMVSAGFEEGSVVGFKWKARLVESDQALKDAQASITDLANQNKKLAEALATMHARINEPSEKEKLAKLQEENNRLIAVSQKIETSVQGTITSNAALVERAQSSFGATSQWGVVYGGDTTIAGARYETDQIAKMLGLTNVSIFLRQGSYRSVALTFSRPEAEQLLYKAKNRRKDAYIVDMGKWCPQQTQVDDYRECLKP